MFEYARDRLQKISQNSISRGETLSDLDWLQARLLEYDDVSRTSDQYEINQGITPPFPNHWNAEVFGKVADLALRTKFCESKILYVDMLRSGIGCKQDIIRSLATLKVALTGSQSLSKYLYFSRAAIYDHLLYCEIDNQNTENAKTALHYYHTARKRMYSPGTYRLAHAYKNGEFGLKVNHRDYLLFLKRAANQMHAVANYELYELYEFGYHDDPSLVPESPSKAMRYLRKSAGCGYIKAIELLARLLAEGYSDNKGQIIFKANLQEASDCLAFASERKAFESGG